MEFQVEQGRQQLSADLLATQQSLSKKRKELSAAKDSCPLNPSVIINLQGEVEALEQGEKALKALEEELF